MISKRDSSVAPVAWQAEPQVRDEICAPVLMRRVAAMLDLGVEGLSPGVPMPRGWHFVLLGADTPRAKLREDGFPGLGVPMPDFGLPRLMLGSRSVRFEQDIPIGAEVLRNSTLSKVEHKTNASGPMAVVTIDHALSLAQGSVPALVETQTFLLLPGRPGGTKAPTPAPAESALEAPTAAHCKTVVPDETLLFHYSALGFNSHRIHLDRTHARDVEGFPDLVVNGGLSTLLMTEFLRVELGVTPRALHVRHRAPLFCNRPITLTADVVGTRWTLKAFDESHRCAVDMEVETA